MEENLSTNPYSDNRPSSNVFRLTLNLILGLLSYLLGIWLFYRFFPSVALPTLIVDSKIFWYVTRASGIIAFVLLWLSMLLGLLMTTKLLPKGSAIQIGNEIHKFVSVLGLVFIIIHALVLIWDEYLQTTLWQLFVPFTIFNYRPLSVGVGQIASYVWFVVLISYYIRRQIGRQTWRIIHYLSFGVYWLVLLHGITAGTDTGTLGMTLLYWSSAGSMIFLTIYRIMLALYSK